MWPEFLQFAAFFLIMVALLKISAAYIADRNPGSALASGLAWFIPA